MKSIAAFVASLLLLIPVAHASPKIEIGAGASYAQTFQDGIWYQEGFPHTLNLRSPIFLIGVTDAITPNLRWHVNWVHLGRYGMTALATSHDNHYNPTNSTHCNGPCLPLLHFAGSGTVSGIAATLEAHTTGQWQFGVEAGPFLYRESWTVQIPDWYPVTQISPAEFVQSGPIQPVYSSQVQWVLGGVLGFSARQGNWTFSFRRYFDSKGFPGHGDDRWPPLWKNHTAAMVTYTFD